METDRLVLRHFRLADAPALTAYRSEPDVARYQSWDAPFPLDAAQRMCAEMAAADPAGVGWFQYAVSLRGSDDLIGDVGVHRHDDRRQADLGFTFAPSHQGRGYASEAVTAVLDRLLLTEGLHRVRADCDARNVASARLLERVGFRREGHLLEATWAKGEWTDDLVFAKLAREHGPRR